MELNTNANQPACYGAPGDLETSNEEGRDHNDDIQKISQSSKVSSVVCEKIVSSIRPDTEAGLPNGEFSGLGTLLAIPSISPNMEASVQSGEYCGLDTQVSIDSVDIFEILRKEILVAEAREREVIENGLLNAGDEEEEESPRDENRVEGLEFEVTGIDLGDSQGHAGNCALQEKATHLRDSSLAQVFLQEEDDGHVESIESPNGGLFEDAFLQEVQEMGAENHEAPSSDVNELESEAAEARDPDFMQVFLQQQAESLGSPNGGLHDDTFFQEGEGIGAKKNEAPPSEDNIANYVLQHEGDMSALPKDSKVSLANHFLQQEEDVSALSEDNKVGLSNRASQHEGDASALSEGNKVGLANHVLQHEGDVSALSEDNKADCENHVLQQEGVMSAEAREVGLVHCHQDAEEIGYDISSDTSNAEVNGDTFSREDDGTGTEKGNATLLDESRADNGDPFLQDEKLDELSEHSEDDGYMPGAFSGPIAFSGMLSYSGMISYSGQIPYSGNLSLHSDSSTSTRSFAFPILASDWNSSPAKIGQPDSRYFRRRRRWRPCFCCSRPTTLFD